MKRVWTAMINNHGWSVGTQIGTFVTKELAIEDGLKSSSVNNDWILKESTQNCNFYKNSSNEFLIIEARCIQEKGEQE